MRYDPVRRLLKPIVCSFVFLAGSVLAEDSATPVAAAGSFADGLRFEVQVNPEFGDAEAAFAEAEKYATAIGRMPAELRKDVETVLIHKGVRPFGGGNNNLLIHTGQADRYVASGILEETLIHEAAHTSLDARHARSQGWRAAQESDARFISNYAREHPFREDIAESYLLYMALRYRPDRIPHSLAETIIETIPNRIAYFDEQDFAMHPFAVVPAVSPETSGEPAEKGDSDRSRFSSPSPLRPSR